MSLLEFAQVSVLLAIAIAIGGIGIQLTRVLGNLNEVMKDAKIISAELSILVTKVNTELLKIIDLIDSFRNPLRAISSGFLEPIANLAIDGGALIRVLRERIFR